METTRKSINLTFSFEDRNGNNITCPSEHSPDSLRSSSSLSCGGSDSPPDVEMEDCLSCPAKHETSSANVVKSCGTVPLDLKRHNWNENMTLLIVDPKHAQSSDGGSKSSPDCGDRQMSEVDSSEPSRRGSSENCCSVSSGEMVMRSNSFLLHETDQPLSISLIGESKNSLDASSDFGVILGMLPDVCEGLAEFPKEEVKNQVLECTYIHQNNQTFLIDERSLSVEKLECVTPVQYHKFNKDMQKLACNTGGSSHSLEGKTVLLTASEDLDISGNAQTSTPVQSVSNKTFCLPNLSESPLNKDEGVSVSPVVAVSQKSESKCAVSQKPKTSASKSNKIEIKRFPKPNFSNIKSKIMSRASNPFKTSNLQVPKTTSSSECQTNESQDMNQCKSSPNKSASATVANTPCIKSFTAAKRTRTSTSQESGPASKTRSRRWSESATSSKTSKDGSQEKNPQVNGVFSNLITPQKNIKGYSQNQSGKSKPLDQHETTREDAQENESLKARGKNPRINLLVSVVVILPLKLY